MDRVDPNLIRQVRKETNPENVAKRVDSHNRNLLRKGTMFTLPNFNLVCNYWVAGNPISNPPDGQFTANLTPGRRVSLQWWPWTVAGSQLVTECILVPAGSPLTSELSGAGAATVEVEAGSGWFYNVAQVVRIARGFANEHLLAVLEPLVPTPQ